MHNLRIKLYTRNWPFFSIKAAKQNQFSANKSETKELAKVAILQTKYYIFNRHFYDDLPQVLDYHKNIQNRSFSSLVERVSRVVRYVKGLLETSKALFYSSLFSIKYRFFSLLKQALIMRENLAWIIEGNFSTREATLGKAFVFADLSGAPESIYHSFKVIGILHLIAASSANIYLILSFFKPLLASLEYIFGQKCLSLSKIFIVIVYFLLINGHFNLVDSSPSILRASLSCILAILAASYFSLAVKSINVLVLVGILCLLINPFYLQSLGFQLSFLASFIILLYWPYVKKRIAKSSIMLGVLVQFMLWPLLIYYFSELNLIAIPANIVIAPLVEFLTILYFLYIFFKSWSLTFFADLASTLIYFIGNIFFNLLDFFDKMPGKSIVISQHKNAIIGCLLLFHCLLIYHILRTQIQLNKKNRYRIFSKWSNWVY